VGGGARRRPRVVERATGESDEELATAIRDRLREVLVVQVQVELVRWGSLPRSEWKATLVER
jgi:phenylacetate-coenzyme A ligase PaaK-like adenylate-forming protein